MLHTGVCAHMQLEIGALYEGLAAYRAHVRLLACMRSVMRVSSGLVAKSGRFNILLRVNIQYKQLKDVARCPS